MPGRNEEFLDKVNMLASRVMTAATLEKRREALAELLEIACAYAGTIKRKLDRFAAETLKSFDLGEAGTNLPLRDLVHSNEALEVFRSKEHLQEYLESAKEVLRLQNRLSKPKIDAIAAEVLRLYSAMLETPMSHAHFLRQFDHLKNAICQPPDDDDGIGPDDSPDDPPPSGGALDRGVKYLTLALRLLQLFDLSVPATDAPQPYTEPPPIHAPAHNLMALLALLAGSACAAGISSVEWMDARTRIKVGAGRSR